jgi:hypothetical protein
MVALGPVPDVVTVPGSRVNVHVPEAGKLVNCALPVDRMHVGGVMVPMAGAVGVVGWTGITTLADAGEVHPTALVTVKLYVPATRPEMFVEVPEPVIPPGFIVHVPLAGNPFKMTLPVDNVQVGGVIVPIVGAGGVTGCGLITTLAEAGEVHPTALVTV